MQNSSVVTEIEYEGQNCLIPYECPLYSRFTVLKAYHYQLKQYFDPDNDRGSGIFTEGRIDAHTFSTYVSTD